MLALHDPPFNASLLRTANRLNPWSRTARDAFLRDVRSQFGEKVAFSYAFNLSYCRCDGGLGWRAGRGGG